MSKQIKLNLFNRAVCERCGALCIIDPVEGSKAKILKRSSKHKGLCIGCAVHDTLRHLYPANLILARSGPKAFMLPEMQRMFYDIVQSASTDAAYEEIDWMAMIRNWELPFPTKLKRFAQNPVTQKELDEEEAYAANRRRADCNIWTEEQRNAKRKTDLDGAITELIRGMHGDRNVDIEVDESHPGVVNVYVKEKKDESDVRDSSTDHRNRS